MKCKVIVGVEDIAIDGRYGKAWAADGEVTLDLDKEYQCVWVGYHGKCVGIPFVALRRWEVFSEEQKVVESTSGTPVGQGQRDYPEGQREQLAFVPKVLKGKG
jgi:hypothetical protein